MTSPLPARNPSAVLSAALSSPRGLAIIIALLSFLVFLPVLRNDFVIWDDGHMVVENIHIRSLNLDFFRWAFTTVSLAEYWQPLAWISHAVDYALWGLGPVGHHLTSVLFHALNTFLVVLLSIRLLEAQKFAAERSESGSGDSRGRGPLPAKSVLIASGVTGLLFAIHPLHVESVAWVTLRRDLLCTFFSLLCLLSYLRYNMVNAGKSVVFRLGSALGDNTYRLAFLYFVLALASKPTAITLPLVLMIVDWYPLDRARSVREGFSLLMEKAPFLLAGMLTACITVIAQQAVGTLPAVQAVPFLSRIAVAMKSLILYIWMSVFPLQLSPLYPYPVSFRLLTPEYLVPAALVAVITVLSVVVARRQRLWLSLWAFFVISLAPVLGLVQVGYQSMADRYLYFPLFAPLLLLGVGSAMLWDRREDRIRGNGAVLAGILLLYVVFLASTTIREATVWKDTIALWTRVITLYPRQTAVAYLNRGVAYSEQHQADLALQDFTTAIELDGMSAAAYNNRGRVYLDRGEMGPALDDFSAAIQRDPRYHLAYNNRALAYKAQGRIDLALADVSAALALKPDYAQASLNRGILYAESGQYDRALADLTEAVKNNPYFADAYTSRGLVFLEQGSIFRALDDFDKAVRLDPASADAWLNRGVAHERMDALDRAVEDLTRVIALMPDDHLAYSYRGNIYGKMGRPADAIRDLTKSLVLHPDDARAYFDRGSNRERIGDARSALTDYQAACGLGSDEACRAARRIR